jgi:hypothetical protein
MYQKKKELAFRVKMSMELISFRYKELAQKSRAVAKKRDAALHDVTETKGVSSDQGKLCKNLCR